jgi:hypothetical protein
LLDFPSAPFKDRITRMVESIIITVVMEVALIPQHVLVQQEQHLSKKTRDLLSIGLRNMILFISPANVLFAPCK